MIYWSWRRNECRWVWAGTGAACNSSKMCVTASRLKSTGRYGLTWVDDCGGVGVLERAEHLVASHKLDDARIRLWQRDPMVRGRLEKSLKVRVDISGSDLGVERREKRFWNLNKWKLNAEYLFSRGARMLKCRNAGGGTRMEQWRVWELGKWRNGKGKS